MGKHFGDLAFVRGIVYYKLSPHELKPFAGAISHGVPNMLIRIRATIYAWLPPLIIGWAIYKSVEDSHHHKSRKNPKDYIDEVDPAGDPPPISTDKKKCA